MKAISVLGSTGSIGTQTLQIAEEFPEQFRVVALTAGRNLKLLVDQVQSCLLYTSPSPRDGLLSRMPSSA